MTVRAGTLCASLICLAMIVASPVIASEDGQTRAPSRSSDALFSWLDTLAEHLSRSSNPRHLMIAARLSRDAERRGERARLTAGDGAQPRAGRHRLSADTLVEQARRLGSTDPWIWWILATDCPGTTACDAAESTRRLRKLAPSNGAVWVLTSHPDEASDASSSHVLAGATGHLAHIAAASRFDLYLGESMRAYLDALEQIPLPDEPVMDASTFDAVPSHDATRGLLAYGLVMAQPLPPLGDLALLCSNEFAEKLGKSHREHCVAAMRTIWREADSVPSERLASRRLLQLLPAGPERDAALRASHRSAWQMENWMSLQQADGANPPRSSGRHAAETFELWRQPGATELDVMRQQLEAAGIPLDPPVHWAPSQPLDPLPITDAD